MTRLVRWALPALVATAVVGPASSGLAEPGGGPGGREPRRTGQAPMVEAGAGAPIRDRYIVVLDKDATAESGRRVRSEARGLGATIHHRYQHAIRGFSATLSGRALQAVRDNPRVSYVEPDRVVTTVDTQSPATWG
ncbi:MAG: protease inhibitor I9 family protein, partial [Actinomycetota bacterium]